MAGANSGSVGRGKVFQQKTVNRRMVSLSTPLFRVDDISCQSSFQEKKDRTYPVTVRSEREAIITPS
jgi:hypothetical protein